MLFRTLHRLGIPSDVFYLASFGSIAASIVAWAVRNEENAAHAERFGIFIGLWAPTFMLIGSGIQQLETHKGMGHPALESVASSVEGKADNSHRRAQELVRS